MQNKVQLLFETYKNNRFILDAMYQWADNPTSMTAGYGIEANLSYIESNLRLRYEKLFNQNQLSNFFSEMDSLIFSPPDKYWIGNLQKSINEYHDLDLSENLRLEFLQNLDT